MASTNQSPEYLAAERKFLLAQTDEEKLLCLEEMIRYCPKHKAGEAMRANIRARIKKLKEKLEEKRKRKQGRKEGIKKEGVQVILIGLTQSGKSSLLSRLTNAHPEISNHEFTTQQPLIGTLNYEGLKFQIIDMPAVNFENFESGIANTADILLIIITNTEELEQILPFLNKAGGKQLIAYNKIDLLNEQERRKIEARLESKKYNFILISCKTLEGINELKLKLLENSGVIRVYTKQPGKLVDKIPVILLVNSTAQKLSEKIFHKNIKIKEIRITGPSSKFPNQIVSSEHILKDKDIVEFKT